MQPPLMSEHEYSQAARAQLAREETELIRQVARLTREFVAEQQAAADEGP